ncbi:hypothetical protein OESDEN_06303 [Oesophagostomum dentatum]|uniref:Uncharacterized protein n=1 Tax=Oesophagostomum dentatum TaxID=61180 RepID=A0A0B1TD76_OESDE|nr:hypothetical protein OESDEN_06303 [Oesophagostomum dentatum]
MATTPPVFVDERIVTAVVKHLAYEHVDDTWISDEEWDPDWNQNHWSHFMVLNKAFYKAVHNYLSLTTEIGVKFILYFRNYFLRATFKSEASDLVSSALFRYEHDLAVYLRYLARFTTLPLTIDISDYMEYPEDDEVIEALTSFKNITKMNIHAFHPRWEIEQAVGSDVEIVPCLNTYYKDYIRPFKRRSPARWHEGKSHRRRGYGLMLSPYLETFSRLRRVVEVTDYEDEGSVRNAESCRLQTYKT